MARAPRRAVAAVALLLSVLLTACSVGPSQRPPVAVRGIPGPAAAATAPRTSVTALPDPPGQHAAILFGDCTTDVYAALPPAAGDRRLRAECGELTVPVDPSAPNLGTITLGVVRTGLDDVPGRVALADRPPLLVLGDTALDPTARHAADLAEQVPLAVLARYTLVGLDRRGTGDDLLDCSPAAARSALLDADPATFDAGALLEPSRTVVQECSLSPDGQLDGFSGLATATDVEVLRQSLGVRTLSAIGTGDAGTALTAWARHDPGSVGRLVLDGPPAPGLDEPERSRGRAASAEAAFDAFALGCTNRSACSLGADPRAAVTALISNLRSRPLTTTDGRRLTAGTALAALRLGLGEPVGWVTLADALAAAGAGDPAPLLAVLDPLLGPRGTFDAVLATGCNDAQRRLAPAQITDLATRWRTAYPLFGGSAAAGLVACAPWPTGGATVTTAAPPPAAGLPPLLVIGTAADPNGPQAGARAAADAVPAARYVAWQGAGTGAYPRTPCVSAAVDGLLVDGTVPDTDTACPP